MNEQAIGGIVAPTQTMEAANTGYTMTTGYMAPGPNVPLPASPEGLQPIWSFAVNQVENGYVVTVGCKTCVATTIEDVIEGMKLYFTDAKAAMKKYTRNN